MTSPCYYDVTHFLTDPNENCTAYVKLEKKDILFVKIFKFSEYLLYCTSIVQLPYTFPPIRFGQPIRVGSVRDTSFTYLRILLQHKIKVFTKIDENQGRYLSPTPPPLGSPLGGF